MLNKSIKALMMLGVHSIKKANSGHPGIVLGASPIIYTLYTKHLKIYPLQPDWINRDRFIMSAGHGSAMLYSINHLSGYNISISDLEMFRNFSKTPGHPERSLEDGIETTSGPLGQGIANAVGLAIAEEHLSEKFIQEDSKIINHNTYVFCGDGDLQEGISYEALSLAGHLKLNKLIVLFDSNDIQLDGKVSSSFSENTKMKMEAMGFNYILVKDGMNPSKIDEAINKAKKSTNKPTFIEFKTTIGFGTSLSGTSEVHGKPLHEKEISDLESKLEWNFKPFHIPKSVYEDFKLNVIDRGSVEYSKWKEELENFKEFFPKKHLSFMEYGSLKNKKVFDVFVNEIYNLKSSNEATRVSGGKILSIASKLYPNLIGGSADLSSSTKVMGLDGDFSHINRLGRNINFGVREHAMGSITNGINLHGTLRAFCSGFFVFTDYMKPSIRLAAIMNLPTIFIMTHDSIAVGEDGPTHQPVEQIVGLRSIPNLLVFRPGNAVEVAASYEMALLSKDKPSLIILSRQNLKPSIGDRYGSHKGAYIISNEKKQLNGILLASGSEVGLAIEAQKQLFKLNIDVRVVSFLSMEVFESQDIEYKKKILPDRTKMLAIEAAHPLSWYKYTRNVIGVKKFGESGDGNMVLEKYGFNTNNVVEMFLKGNKDDFWWDYCRWRSLRSRSCSINVKNGEKSCFDYR